MIQIDNFPQQVRDALDRGEEALLLAADRHMVSPFQAVDWPWHRSPVESGPAYRGPDRVRVRRRLRPLDHRPAVSRHPSFLA